MLEVSFHALLISVSSDTLGFSLEAKKGLNISIGFGNRKGVHKMVDLVVDKVVNKAGYCSADIRFLIRDTDTLDTIKEFSVHLKDGNKYEFSELE